MKKYLLTAILILTFAFSLQAQVTVTGANPGSNGSFATLKLAFDAINGQTQTGYTILVQITNNTTETETAILNASAWDSLIIYPTATGKTISGSTVRINGSKVLIDGRLNRTGSTVDLTFNHTLYALLIAGSNNTIKYCTIKSSVSYSNSGALYLSNCSNNVIENNNFTGTSSTSRPVACIYSLGSASTPNTGTIIRNNNFYDFLNFSSFSNYGIFMDNYNGDYSVTGNSFYETSTYAPVNNINTITCISANNATGTVRIDSNYIGGSQPMCGGTPFTKTNTYTTFSVIGIYIAPQISSTVTLNRNIIRNITWTGAANTSFNPIYAASGSNPGTIIRNNIVGDTTGTGSITTENSTFNGIYIVGKTGGTLLVDSNIVGSVTNGGTSGSFNGISVETSVSTDITGNKIGSSATANSINMNSTADRYMSGLNVANSSTGGIVNLRVWGNKISNLNNATTGTYYYSAGIYAQGNGDIYGNTISNITTSGALTTTNPNSSTYQHVSLMGIFSKQFDNNKDTVYIRSNTVSNLTNTYSTFAGAVTGILYNSFNTSQTVRKYANISGNFIHSLAVTGASSTSAKIFGTYDYSYSATSDFLYSNNIISIGGNTSTNIYGHFDNSSNSQKFNFNTIYISGSPASGATESVGLFTNTYNTRENRNNIIVNNRSNSGTATGSHYILYLTSNSYLAYNYNNYYYSGTGNNKFGKYSSTDYATLSAWAAANLGERNSTNVNPQFASAGGTQAVNYKTAIELRGNNTTGITKDYEGTTRKIYPTMGAFEYIPTSFPVTVTASSGTLSAQYTRLDDALLALNMGMHKGNVEVKFSESHTVTPLSLAGNDRVGAVVVSSNGYYTSAPTVTFSSPASGVTATGTPVMLGALLVDIIITNRGSGYTEAPTITISGTGGAVATAYLPDYSSVNIFPTASGLQIGGELAGTIFNFDGADNVTIDGRVNATGSTADLLIINTHRKFPAVNFINDATYNTVKYSTIKAQNDSSGSFSAAIQFLGGITTGNNNNTVNKSNITSVGKRNYYGLFSQGTSESIKNSSNTVSDNMFYGLIDSAHAYIMLWDYNDSWSITGNRFYEPLTITKGFYNSYKSFIRIQNKGGAYTVNNNYFGGSSSSGTGKWTFNSHPADFCVIRMQVDSVNASNIQGNTITNIDFPAESTSGLKFYGIYAFGSINIGTEAPNIIGSATGNDAIILNATGTNSVGFTGVYAGGAVQNIKNNIIGAVKISSSSTGGGAFTGIYCYYATRAVTIKNNTIGSMTDAASINLSAPSTIALNVYGIYVYYCSVHLSIDSNRVANIVNANISSSTTGGKTWGIVAEGPAGTNYTFQYSILNNTVKDITAANNYSYLSSYNYICTGGIYLYNRGAVVGQTISGNTVNNITNTNSSFSGFLTGIFLDCNGSNYENKIERNFVSGLSVNSASTGSSVTGIQCEEYTKISNNIIGITGNFQAKVFGLRTNIRNHIYFNSVYLNGTVSAGSNSSYSYYVNDLNYAYLMNNVFANLRSNSGGTGKHYSIYVGTASGIIYLYGMNYNDYYISGTGGITGYYLSDKSTLASWKTTFSRDTNSLSTNPGFTGGTGVNGYKPGVGLPGLTIAGYPTDYSGTTRGATPTMGALESSAISVTATSGESSGFFNTLKETFDAINAGTHKGSITIKINTGIVETQTAVLNASGGTANYSGISIYPTSSNLSISGNIAGAPLIDLNGADNVSIRGDLNGTGGTANMIISNTSTSSTDGTSSVRLQNDASNNSVQYCILKGSSLAPSSVEGGILSIGESNGTTGNDYNTINYNKFTNADGNRPLKGIYSGGSSGKDNDNNTIYNNEFYDIMNLGSSEYSAGISVLSSSTYYTVQQNSFYETSSYAPGGNGDYYAILIDNASGNYFRVLNNYIGGTAANCGGSMLTKTNSGSNKFYGIYMNVGTATESVLSTTYINQIVWSNSAAADFYGVYALSGAVSISQVNAGNSGATPQITLKNGASGGAFYGVYSNTSGSRRVIQNNTVGAIKTDNNSLNSTDFFGIYAAGSGKYKLTNNTIGSNFNANSILLSSASTGNPQLCYGIYAAFTGTEKDSIFSNTIANLTNNSSNTAPETNGLINGIYAENGYKHIYLNSVYNLKIANANSANAYNSSAAGIVLKTQDAYANDISFNTIYNISNTYPSFYGYIHGIYYNGSSTASNIYSNFIYSLSSGSVSLSKESKEGVKSDVSSDKSEDKKLANRQVNRNPKLRGVPAGANICGLSLAGGNSLTYNNIINLGDNNPYALYGIADFGGTNDVYFNSVYLGGSPSTGMSSSYAFYSNSSSTRNLKNNIFFNARSNNGATGTHYALGVQNTTGLTINYNDYYGTGSGYVLGIINFSDVATLSALQTATGQDANSFNTDPIFTNAGAATKESYKTNDYFPAAAIAGITKDIYPYTRGTTQTNIGAWECNIWKGTGGSDYFTNTSWVKGAYPGSEETIIIDASAISSCNLNSSVSFHSIINNSSQYNFVLGSYYSINVKGNIKTNSTGKITANTGSTLVFNGNSVQNINAGSFTNSAINNLQMNKTGTGIAVLTGNLTVNGSLAITSGKLIIADGSSLTHAYGSYITGSFSANNMIVPTGTGELKCKTAYNNYNYIFPIGDTTGTDEYSPVNLNFSSGASSSAYVSAKVFNVKHPNNNSQNNYIKRYWTLSQTGLSTFTCTGNFYYTVADVVGTESNIYAGKWNGTTWSSINQTNYTSHYLYPTITGFSDFTGGEQGALPVTLSSFNSSVNARDVKLRWTTESEENNSGFEVERICSSGDSTWKKISFVSGSGTTNSPVNYSYSDLKMSTGKYNYRLKQIDHNGNHTYFNLNNTIEIGIPTKYDISQNYPNPFNPTTKIDFALPVDSKVTIAVYDITGREIARLINNEYKKANYYTVEFNAGTLSSGAYFYRIVTDKYVMSKKMVLLK